MTLCRLHLHPKASVAVGRGATERTMQPACRPAGRECWRLVLTVEPFSTHLLQERAPCPMSISGSERDG